MKIIQVYPSYPCHRADACDWKGAEDRGYDLCKLRDLLPRWPGDFAETPPDLGGLPLSGADVMVLACHPRGFASEASGPWSNVLCRCR